MSVPTTLSDGGSTAQSGSEAKPVSRVVRTRPRADGRINPTTEYSGLLSTVRDAGLLRRRTGFYYTMFAVLVLALGGIVTGFVLNYVGYQIPFLVASVFAAITIIITRKLDPANQKSPQRLQEEAARASA